MLKITYLIHQLVCVIIHFTHQFASNVTYLMHESRSVIAQLILQCEFNHISYSLLGYDFLFFGAFVVTYLIHQFERYHITYSLLCLFITYLMHQLVSCPMLRVGFDTISYLCNRSLWTLHRVSQGTSEDAFNACKDCGFG